MLKSYAHTKAACYLGYVTQAIANNFVPLLFVLFRQIFGLSLAQVTALVVVNFSIQFFTDLLFAKLADKLGYRTCLCAAHMFAAAGLAGLTVLPRLFGNAFAGLLTAVALYALGGGIIEVLVSPTVEACPSKNKAAQMSLLHSFYCWGAAAVVLFSTGFLYFFGEARWRILALIWAALPLCNGVYFLFVPFAPLLPEGEGLSIRRLFAQKQFWLYAALIALAGAAELSMSQWASFFAENGLNVSKAVGDLTGPCLFAVFMGTARVLYARSGKRLRLWLLISGVLCAVCYLVAWLSPLPVVALCGCALCGFSVGLMWPGIFSTASEAIPRGGTAMFALLALAGDAGCLVGPALVGFCAGAFGDDVGTGLAFALIFPVLFIILMACLGRNKKSEKENQT